MNVAVYPRELLACVPFSDGSILHLVSNDLYSNLMYDFSSPDVMREEITVTADGSQRVTIA